jgi:hypothetical protein
MGMITMDLKRFDRLMQGIVRALHFHETGVRVKVWADCACKFDPSRRYPDKGHAHLARFAQTFRFRSVDPEGMFKPRCIHLFFRVQSLSLSWGHVVLRHEVLWRVSG